MSRLSKEAQENIDKIIRGIASQVYTNIKKLHNTSNQINVLVTKQLQNKNVNKSNLRKASSEATLLWLKCSDLYNKVYKEGASGLKIHSYLKEAKNIANNLRSIIENLDIIESDLNELFHIIQQLESQVARTGYIESPNTQNTSKPVEEKDNTPKELKFVIATLSEIIDDTNNTDAKRYLAQGFLARIIKTKNTGGDNYNQLIDNNCAEAIDMLEKVYSINY